MQPAGIRTPREAGGKAQGAARSEAPAHPTVAPPGRSVGVAALHLVGPVSHAIKEGMGVCAGEGEVQDPDGRLMRPLWPAAAARVHVGTGRGSLASKHYLQL